MLSKVYTAFEIWQIYRPNEYIASIILIYGFDSFDDDDVPAFMSFKSLDNDDIIFGYYFKHFAAVPFARVYSYFANVIIKLPQNEVAKCTCIMIIKPNHFTL